MADLKQSMWMAWLDLYSPWLSFWKPISLCMFSPWRAARVSTKGLTGNTVRDVNTIVIRRHVADSPVKKVTIVGHKDVWFSFLNVVKPPLEESRLQPQSNWHILWDALIKQSMLVVIDIPQPCTSSSSLKTVNGPSYSGLGVNSKSSMFSETISRFVIRNPFWK